MIKRSALILFVIISLFSISAEIPDDTPISISLDEVVSITNATSSWVIELYNQNITGLGQTICIIDTGINFSHPDILGKNLTCNIDCFAKTCIENCSISDDNGHGTHVAGIVAANGGKTGIAKDAKLIGVKALDSNGNGQLSYLVNGIIWCTDNSETYNITTISMSLGTSSPYLYNSYCDAESSSTTNAINNAIAKNISIIAATGNNGATGGLGNTTHISLPSCIKNATSVSATNDDNSIASSYANYNSITELFAPGTGVFSLNYQTSGYESRSGTSMSTPAVAGAFALINQLYQLQKNKQPTPDFIQNILTSKGKTIAENFIRIDILTAILELSKANITLISPTNNTETFIQTNFSCNASSPSNYTIQNLTFYLWNNTGLIYQETKTPDANNATFNYTLDIDFYKWNCLAIDGKNYQSFALSNNTINFTEIQAISLLFPERNAILTTNYTTFTFNTSINTSDCSLIINNQINLTTLNITNYSFTQNLSNGNYNWSINCTTNESLTNSSSTRTLTINYNPVIAQEETPSTGGSSGGSGSSLATEYKIDEEKLKKGTTIKLNINNRVNIKIREKEHTLTVKKLNKTSTQLLIESEPQYLELEIGETKKISLEDNYYNLEIKLNSILFNKINISLQEILEPIDLPIKAIENKTITNDESENKSPKSNKNWLIYEILIVIISIIFGIIIIVYFLTKEHKDKELN